MGYRTERLGCESDHVYHDVRGRSRGRGHGVHPCEVSSRGCCGVEMGIVLAEEIGLRVRACCRGHDRYRNAKTQMEVYEPTIRVLVGATCC